MDDRNKNITILICVRYHRSKQKSKLTHLYEQSIFGSTDVCFIRYFCNLSLNVLIIFINFTTNLLYRISKILCFDFQYYSSVNLLKDSGENGFRCIVERGVRNSGKSGKYTYFIILFSYTHYSKR